jgi:hypothetical protein
MLNLRINDMMTQLNVVLKALMDENNSLKSQLAPKAKPNSTEVKNINAD